MAGLYALILFLLALAKGQMDGQAGTLTLSDPDAGQTAMMLAYSAD